MKLKFDRQKGANRLKKRFYNAMPATEIDLWFQDGKWLTPEKLAAANYSSNSGPIRTVRAFRRALKQWSHDLPPGTEFVLLSRFLGCDVIGKTK